MSEDNETAAYAVIIAAAGQSRRFVESGANENAVANAAVKKPYTRLHGKPIWLYSTEMFARRNEIKQIILVVAPEDVSWFRDYFAAEIDKLLLMVISGGTERVDSVQKAFALIRNNIDYIAVHDAARPCISDEQITAVFKQAKQHGAAILASPITGTIKLVDNNTINATVPRKGLWEAQTPQVFRKQILFDAYSKRDANVLTTDDAELVEKAGFNVSVVLSDRLNIKITNQSDLKLAEAIMSIKK
ncbi:MAG: 2-C-methyl-D-erythritol 4-phosphate cytidylyltransferase [Planctomycetaceae bacterium]|nr:2-C-methyl-D-erythritol 4-phosphate cytidylyltransferase [Planctomycetaceae bacterium]